MKAKWISDLSRSALDFVEIIWPRVSRYCGGGELRPVEGSTTQDLERSLDVLAGIDAWQTVGEKGMRGIASRVQWITNGSAFDTFTIRYARDSGTVTEFAKRLRALDETDRGWLYPHLTIQGYVKDQERSFLSAAVVQTRELYRRLKNAGIDGISPLEKYRPGDDYGLQRTDNASFLVVGWRWLGQDVKVARNGQQHKSKKPLPPFLLQIKSEKRSQLGLFDLV